jgi:hypothetical protein
MYEYHKTKLGLKEFFIIVGIFLRVSLEWFLKRKWNDLSLEFIKNIFCSTCSAQVGFLSNIKYRIFEVGSKILLDRVIGGAAITYVLVYTLINKKTHKL